MVFWPHILEQNIVLLSACGRSNSSLHVQQEVETKWGSTHVPGCPHPPHSVGLTACKEGLTYIQSESTSLFLLSGNTTSCIIPCDLLTPPCNSKSREFIAETIHRVQLFFQCCLSFFLLYSPEGKQTAAHELLNHKPLPL